MCSFISLSNDKVMTSNKKLFSSHDEFCVKLRNKVNLKRKWNRHRIYFRTVCNLGFKNILLMKIWLHFILFKDFGIYSMLHTFKTWNIRMTLFKDSLCSYVLNAKIKIFYTLNLGVWALAVDIVKISVVEAC